MSSPLLQVVAQRYSGRLLIAALAVSILSLTPLFELLNARELFFFAMVTAVYLFWLPTRYLVVAACFLLISAATNYIPLEETTTEELLRITYYLIFLIVARELFRSIFIPEQYSLRIATAIIKVEYQHYQALISLGQRAERSINLVFQWLARLLRLIRTIKKVSLRKGRDWSLVTLDFLVALKYLLFLYLKRMRRLLRWWWQRIFHSPDTPLLKVLRFVLKPLKLLAELIVWPLLVPLVSKVWLAFVALVGIVWPWIFWAMKWMGRILSRGINFWLRILCNFGRLLLLSFSARRKERLEAEYIEWYEEDSLPRRKGLWSKIRKVLRFGTILVFFGLLTSAVVGPWFLIPGHLFLLDFVWPQTLPTPQPSNGFTTSLPYDWMFWGMTQLMPVDLVQKIIFTLPLLLAGLSAAHLVGWIIKKDNGEPGPLLALLVAGAFYALNSFVTIRIFMGHFNLLMGYALAPWAVLATLKFREKPTIRRGLLAGLMILIVMVSDAHHIILLSLIIGPLFIVPRRPKWRHVWAAGAFAAPIVVLAVVFWIGRASSTFLSVYDPQGPWARLLQAPASGNLWLDIVTLTAHWKTDLLFAFPYDFLSFFPYMMIVFLVLIGIGVWYLWWRRSSDWLVWQLLVVAAVSIFLAGGVAHSFSEPVAAWLYRHVPLWIGMRDSAKFIGNVALIEAIFLGVGMAWLNHAILSKVTRFIIFIITLWFVSPAFGGFAGQVLPVSYPYSWEQWNDELAEHESGTKMLVLPWHMYPALDWLESRPIINPAANFFTAIEAIVGDNNEVGGLGGSVVIYSESNRPFSKKIESILGERKAIKKFGEAMAPESIGYVALLADASDAEKYRWLYKQADLKLVFESPELVVWANTALEWEETE
jgi:hypothetical protein